jgi:dTDP-4-dehydrorhamnose 3,5-epimerase-like enzyme
MTDQSPEASTSLGKVTAPESFADPRGVLTVVAPSGNFNFMEVVTFVGPELIRGNHYHSAYRERAFVQAGSIDVVLRTQDSSNETKLTLEEGQLIDIPPGIIHAFISRGPATVICFGSGSSPAEDRHRVE